MGGGLDALELALLNGQLASQRVVLAANGLDGRAAAASVDLAGGAGTNGCPVLQPAAQRDPGLQPTPVLLTVPIREVMGGASLPAELVRRLAIEPFEARAGRPGCRC